LECFQICLEGKTEVDAAIFKVPFPNPHRWVRKNAISTIVWSELISKTRKKNLWKAKLGKDLISKRRNFAFSSMLSQNTAISAMLIEYIFHSCSSLNCKICFISCQLRIN